VFNLDKVIVVNGKLEVIKDAIPMKKAPRYIRKETHKGHY